MIPLADEDEVQALHDIYAKLVPFGIPPLGVIFLDEGPWTEDKIAFVRDRIMARGWSSDPDSAHQEESR